MGAQQVPPCGTAPGAASTARAGAARLLRRRRGWLWTGLISLYGFAVYGIISGSYLSSYGTAPLAAVMSKGTVPFLLIMAVTGLGAAAADTVRLRRVDGDTRASALAATYQWPIRAHPYCRGPGDRASWWSGWLVLLALSVPAVLYLPHELAAITYLAGIGPQDGPLAALPWSGAGDAVLTFSARALAWLAGPTPAFGPRFGDAVDVLDLGLVFDGFACLTAAVIQARARYLIQRRHEEGRPPR